MRRSALRGSALPHRTLDCQSRSDTHRADGARIRPRRYSGVGVYARRPPDAYLSGFGNPEFDAVGRCLEVRYGALSVISVYFPSGSSSELRQEAKYRFMHAFMPHLIALKQEREVILCGDINIAHKEIDLKNWRSNQKHSGFLPEERA